MDWNTADILKTMDKISSARAALHRCPAGHPERAFFLSQLGLGIWDRFHITGRPVDLDECIRLNREALRLRPVGNLQRASSLNNLGMGLYTRFQQTSCLEDLNEYIKFLGEVVLLRSVGHPQHTSSLNNLSSALRVRFRQKGQLKDLDECIRLNEEALHSCSNSDRSSFLQNIIVALTDRFKLTGHLKDLTKSIQLNQEVLVYRPLGHPGRASSLRSLGVSLRTRFQQKGQLEDLNHSVKLHQEALHLCPVGHPERASILHSLGVGHRTRFQHTSYLEDLNKAIPFHREALQLCPVVHPERASMLHNLGVGLRTRFQHTSCLKDLDESIQLDREALLLRPVGHPKRASSLQSLGEGLWDRVCHTLAGKLVVLDEPVESHLDALLLHPVAHKKHVSSLETLGIGLGTRFEYIRHDMDGSHKSRLEDLNESIKLHREALRFRPTGHPKRASSLKNLGVSLGSSCHLEDLNESVQLHREALLLLPVGHPELASLLNSFSVCLWNRFQKTHHQEDLIECVSTSKRSAKDIYSRVSDCLKGVENWVKFTRPHHNLAQSNLDAYIKGLSLISYSLSMMPVISLQYRYLSSIIHLPEFVSDAASQAIRLGQLPLAVELIEQGRGLLWSELRRLRTPMDRLCARVPSLANELMQINHRLEQLSMENSVEPGADLHLQPDSPQNQMDAYRDPFGHKLSKKHSLLRDRSLIIAKIRQVSGFDSFLRQKSFDDLKSAAKHGPIILVNCSRYRSDVLIILEQNSPVLIPMVEGCYDEVKALARRLTKARSNIKTNPKLYNHILQTTLHELWDLIVSPVVTKLQELHIPDMSRIFWCPTSILSTLPLHAAGPASHDKKKFFLPDLYISSYTPTLTALITAFNPTESSLQLPRLLVAGQYDNFLRNTKKEVNEVVQYRKHIAVTSLEEASATKNAVEKSLVDHEWLHIASHGTLVPTEPFSSYFSLAGGSRFTLLDVIRLNLPNATFAFLSACHTAEQSPGSVHNEVIHLAAAMQFCGFRSVVGTMWEMADVDGPEMVKDFYSYVFSDENRSRCNETGVPARALSEAIRKMRRKKGVTLERWVNFVHIGA